MPEAGISKNYCATNSGLPEVELRFCPWIILFNFWTGRTDLRSSLCPYYVYMHSGAPQPNGTGPQIKFTYTEWLKIQLLYQRWNLIITEVLVCTQGRTPASLWYLNIYMKYLPMSWIFLEDYLVNGEIVDTSLFSTYVAFSV
jgi:hypothetical protein